MDAGSDFEVCFQIRARLSSGKDWGSGIGWGRPLGSLTPARESVDSTGRQAGVREPSAGLGVAARECRGRDPVSPAQLQSRVHSTAISLRGAGAGSVPRQRFVSSYPPRSAPGLSAAWPGAPRTQPPEVRTGGPGEDPETPTRTNQVSDALLLDTSIIKDEVFPDVSLLLTAHLSPEEKRGRVATLIQQKHPLEASSGSDTEAVLQPQRVEMALLSNILAAYSFVSENPERAALYFVSGVCVGLVLTLVALVMRISCHTDCRRRPPRRKFLQDEESSSESSDSEDGSLDTASDLSVRRHRRFERTLNKNVFTSAEELERAQRLEERERIIREIWMNGQPEVPGTRSLNRYY
nr:protein eva-1 homolog A [Loxodonta africana]